MCIIVVVRIGPSVRVFFANFAWPSVRIKLPYTNFFRFYADCILMYGEYVYIKCRHVSIVLPKVLQDINS